MNKKINIICYTSMLFLGIYLAIYQNSINYITEGILNKSTVMGILVALHFIGIMVSPITSGEIGDRVGKKKVFIAAFVVILSGISIVFLFKSVFLIALGIFLIGCGSGSIESLGSSILADVNPTDTNRVINISQVFYSAGAVLGPLISLKIVEVSGNWKLSYLLAFFVFAVMLVITATANFSSFSIAGRKIAEVTASGANLEETRLKSEPAKETQDKGLYAARLAKDKYLRFLCLSIFLYVGIESASSFWITSYFSDVLNVEKFGSYALSGFWGGMIIGRYIGSRLEEKSRQIFNAGLILSILSIVICLIIRTPISGLINFTLLGFGFAVIWPVLMTSAAKRYPQNTGTAMGMMMTTSAIGGMVIPFLMGILGDAFSITAGLTVVPISALMILIIHNNNLKTGKNNHMENLYN